MSLSKFEVEETGIPKWQVALAIGGSILVGAGIYYYVIKSDKKDKIPSSKKKVTEAKEEKQEEEVIQTPLGKAQALKNKGNKYFKGGKYKEAINCYDEAIQSCPKESSVDLSTFYQNRAAAYEQLKNWENVLRDCTSALELNCRYSKALSRRARACEVLQDLEQALEDLTAVIIIESFQNQSTLMDVDRLLKELGRQHAKEAMEKREPIMPSKHYIKTFFESFAEDPVYNSIYKEKEGDVDESDQIPDKCKTNNGYLKAKENILNGNYGNIIECTTNELSNPLSQFTPQALLLRGTMHQLKGEGKKALADFTRLIDMNDAPLKEKVNALVKRGSLHMQYEEVSKSISDFDYAATLDPVNSDIFHHRGQIHLLSGKVDSAMDDFDRAVKLNENFPIAFVQKCYTDYRFYCQQEDKIKVSQVMKKFEEAMKNFPKCVECYVLYAQVLCDQNEYAKADEYYVKSFEVDPENPTTLVHRALLTLQWKGDLQTARNYITQALEIDDKCELAYENLATIEVQTGNLKGGIELFNKAIPLAKTEMEMAHLFSLRDAAVAQQKVVEKMNIKIPNYVG